MKNVLGPAIKEIRKQKNMTQKELSSLTGFSQNTISNHENQNRSIDESDIKTYAQALNVSPQYLFDMVTPFPEHNKAIINLFARLNEDRKEKVLDFATFQLKEQLAEFKREQDKKENNVVSYPNKTEIDTIAAHRVDETATASPEDKAKLHSKLDEMDRKFDEQQKRIKAAEDAKRGGSDE